MNKMSKAIAIAAAVAGLASAPFAFAHDDKDAKSSEKSQDMQEMMQGGGTGMMPMMGMMSQMTEMMGTCNRMMQTMMPEVNKPAEERKQPNNG